MLQTKIQIIEPSINLDPSQQVTSNSRYSSSQRDKSSDEFQRQLQQSQEQQSSRQDSRAESKSGQAKQDKSTVEIESTAEQSAKTTKQEQDSESTKVKDDAKHKEPQAKVEKAPDVNDKSERQGDKSSKASNFADSQLENSPVPTVKQLLHELLLNSELSSSEREQLIQHIVAVSPQSLETSVELSKLLEQLPADLQASIERVMNQQSGEDLNKLQQLLALLQNGEMEPNPNPNHHEPIEQAVNNTVSKETKSAAGKDTESELDKNVNQTNVQTNNAVASPVQTDDELSQLEQTNKASQGKQQWLDNLLAIVSANNTQHDESKIEQPDESAKNKVLAGVQQEVHMSESDEQNSSAANLVGLPATEQKAEGKSTQPSTASRQPSTAANGTTPSPSQQQGVFEQSLQQVIAANNSESPVSDIKAEAQAAQDKTEQLQKAFAPSVLVGGVSNDSKSATNQSANVVQQLAANSVENQELSGTQEELLAANTQQKSTKENAVLNTILNSETSAATNKESVTTTAAVEVQGVKVEPSLVTAKQENVGQIKQDNILRESILFNKQELANNIQQQVGLMLARNMKSVDIRLDPPELGSMQIKLSVNNEQAAVSFVVSNQQTKDALEAAMPRLKEMLQEQGMQLADSDVKKDNSKGKGDDAETQPGQAAADSATAEEVEMEQGVKRVVNSPWNVDYYA